MKTARAHRKMGWGALILLVPLGAILGGMALLVLPEAQSTEAARAQSQGTRRELWFFFSPESGDLSAELRRARSCLERHTRVRFRPCLVVKDFRKLKRPGHEFARTVRALNRIQTSKSGKKTKPPLPFSLSVWDREGIRMARMIGIDRLPAYGLVTRNRIGGVRKAHVAYGVDANLKELFRCK